MSSKLEKCGRCGKTVYLTERKIAINKTWHESCFSCVECNIKLTSQSFLTHKGELFCKNCYPESTSYIMDYNNELNSKIEPEIEENSNIRPSEIKQAMKKRRRIIKGHSSEESLSASPKTRKSEENTSKICKKGCENNRSPRHHSSEDSAYETGNNRLYGQKLCAKFKPNLLCPNCNCPGVQIEKIYPNKPSSSNSFRNNRNYLSASIILNRNYGDHELIIKHPHDRNEDRKKKSVGRKEKSKVKNKDANQKQRGDEKLLKKSEEKGLEELLFVSDSGNVKIVKITNPQTKENGDKNNRKQRNNNKSLSDESIYRKVVRNELLKSNKFKNKPKDSSLYYSTCQNRLKVEENKLICGQNPSEESLRETDNLNSRRQSEKNKISPRYRSRLSERNAPEISKHLFETIKKKHNISSKEEKNNKPTCACKKAQPLSKEESSFNPLKKSTNLHTKKHLEDTRIEEKCSRSSCEIFKREKSKVDEKTCHNATCNRKKDYSTIKKHQENEEICSRSCEFINGDKSRAGNLKKGKLITTSTKGQPQKKDEICSRSSCELNNNKKLKAGEGQTCNDKICQAKKNVSQGRDKDVEECFNEETCQNIKRINSKEGHKEKLMTKKKEDTTTKQCTCKNNQKCIQNKCRDSSFLENADQKAAKKHRGQNLDKDIPVKMACHEDCVCENSRKTIYSNQNESLLCESKIVKNEEKLRSDLKNEDPPGKIDRFKNLFGVGDMSKKMKDDANNEEISQDNRPKSPTQDFFRDIFKKKDKVCEDTNVCKDLKKNKAKGETCGLPTCPFNKTKNVESPEELSEESIQQNPLPAVPKGPRFKIRALNPPKFSIFNRFMKKKQMQPIPEDKIETNKRDEETNGKQSSVSVKNSRRKSKLSVRGSNKKLKSNRSYSKGNHFDVISEDSSITKKNRETNRKIIEDIFDPPVASTPHLDRKQRDKRNSEKIEDKSQNITRPSTAISPTRGRHNKNNKESQKTNELRVSSAPVKERTPRNEDRQKFDPPVASNSIANKIEKQKKSKRYSGDEFASIDDYYTPLTYKIPENVKNRKTFNKTDEKTIDEQKKNRRSSEVKDNNRKLHEEGIIDSKNKFKAQKNDFRNTNNINKRILDDSLLDSPKTNDKKTKGAHRKANSVDKTHDQLYTSENQSKTIESRKKNDRTLDTSLKKGFVLENEKKTNKKHETNSSLKHRKLSNRSFDSFKTATSKSPSRKNTTNYKSKNDSNRRTTEKKPLKFGHIYSEEEFFGPAVKPNSSFCSCSTEEKFLVTTEISPNKKNITNRMSSGENKTRSRTSLRSIYTHIDRTEKFIVTNEISPKKNPPVRNFPPKNPSANFHTTNLKKNCEDSSKIEEIVENKKSKNRPETLFDSNKNIKQCKRLRSGSEFGNSLGTFSNPGESYRVLPLNHIESKVKKFDKNDRLLSFNNGLTTDICKRCKLKVYITERNMAAGAVFHKWCFTCYSCQKHLDSMNLLTRHDEIFCQQCYMKLFGPHIYGFGLSPNLHYFD